MKTTDKIALSIALPLAIILHYLIFSKVNMHPTLHAFIGILLFFIILGTAIVFLGKKKKLR